MEQSIYKNLPFEKKKSKTCIQILNDKKVHFLFILLFLDDVKWFEIPFHILKKFCHNFFGIIFWIDQMWWRNFRIQRNFWQINQPKTLVRVSSKALGRFLFRMLQFMRFRIWADRMWKILNHRLYLWGHQWSAHWYDSKVLQRHFRCLSWKNFHV